VLGSVEPVYFVRDPVRHRGVLAPTPDAAAVYDGTSNARTDGERRRRSRESDERPRNALASQLTGAVHRASCGARTVERVAQSKLNHDFPVGNNPHHLCGGRRVI
jgi:hypothetical protein